MINKHKLSNGITVVTEYLPHVASVAMGVWIKAGAVDENSNSGISHFIEHMMFKGTSDRTYKMIAEDIEKLGGNINAFTGKECTCYYIKALSSNFDKNIDVLIDILTNSVFDENEMEKEKGVIIEEMKMIEDVPDDYGHDLITSAIFTGSPLGNSIIGTRESVTAINRDDIVSFISQRYTPDTVLISCVGKFDEDALLAKLEEGFAGIVGSTNKREYNCTPNEPIRNSLTRDIEQTHLFIGKKGLPLDHENLMALNLYSSILGGGMSSRLFSSVREEQGLAYSVFSMDSAFVNDGQFLIYAGVSDDKLLTALKAIKDEIVKLAQTKVPEDELAKVKEQYKGAYIFRRESNSSKMFEYGRNMLLLDKIYSEEEILSKMDSVTIDDIMLMAEKFADFSEYSSIIISSKDTDISDLLS